MDQYDRNAQDGEMISGRWSEFNYARKTPLTPLRIEQATDFFENEDAKFNHKHDTLHFESEEQQDDADLLDNLTDTGWPYSD